MLSNTTTVEALRWKKFPVLDDGFVCLVDCMGDDYSVVEAARVSYGIGTRKVSDDRTLLRYLMRHRHTTPFEMAELKFLVRVPMDCWRQWIRHRTANVNEYSTRYSEAIDSAQKTPCTEWRKQATGNRQGSGGTLQREDWPGDFDLTDNGGVSATLRNADPHPGEWLTHRERKFQQEAREIYEERLKLGVAREQARKDLPLSTYTEAYWKCDLKNLLGFLVLRMEAHAQLEIRSYATTIGEEIVAELFPESYQAFLDYHLNALTLSAVEVLVLRGILLRIGGAGNGEIRDLLPEEWQGEKCRERDEFREKLARLGILAAI